MGRWPVRRDQAKSTISCEPANYFHSSGFTTPIWCRPSGSGPKGREAVNANRERWYLLFPWECLDVARGQRSSSRPPPWLHRYIASPISASSRRLSSLPFHQNRTRDSAVLLEEAIKWQKVIHGKRREIRNGRLRQSTQWQDSLPCLSFFFPMLITVFVFLGDEGLHALCNIRVNHSLMSLSGYKKERFSSTKTYSPCAYALLGFDAEREGGRGGRTQWGKKERRKKQEGWKMRPSPPAVTFKNPSCLVNLYFPQSAARTCLIWQVTGAGKETEK